MHLGNDPQKTERLLEENVVDDIMRVSPMAKLITQHPIITSYTGHWRTIQLTYHPCSKSLAGNEPSVARYMHRLFLDILYLSDDYIMHDKFA